MTVEHYGNMGIRYIRSPAGNTYWEDTFILGFDLFMGFGDNKKNIEHHQNTLSLKKSN